VFTALGTMTAFATTSRCAFEAAETILREELIAIDLSCSRFRIDSEISRAHEQGGRAVVISQLLTEVVQAALDVARETNGAVDPTVGAAVNALGYDRDFDGVPASLPAPTSRARPAAGWSCIELDSDERVLRIPKGVVLDLGATAKAFAADRAAARMARTTGCGVLVNLGGDIAVAGPAPVDGWPVGIAASCRTSPDRTDEVVAIRAGGLASSGTSVRSWWRGGRQLHHIVDPKTGDNPEVCWQLVSVAASSAVAANSASTAAIVWGEAAIRLLSGMGHSCRLVHASGSVVKLGGWPEDLEIESSPLGTAAR
jgi:thiamine biosynthesis lipoprotein